MKAAMTFVGPKFRSVVRLHPEAAPSAQYVRRARLRLNFTAGRRTLLVR